MGVITKVHVLRHGEVHNPEGILYGRLPGYRLSASAGWAVGRPGHATAELLCQGQHIGDQVLGAIGLDLLRRTRPFVAPQVGRDATVTVREVQQQAVPDECTFRKAVQEQQHRRILAASGTA